MNSFGKRSICYEIYSNDNTFYMILHLVFDDKFVDYSIKQFMPYGNSEFVLVKTSAQESIKYIKRQDELTIYPWKSEAYENFLENLSRYNAIILHGFYTPWQVEVVEHAPSEVKICWAFWGGDKYQRADICDSYLSPYSKFLVKMRRLLKGQTNKPGYEVPMKSLQRVDYLLEDSYENFEDVRNYIHKPDLKFLWYTYYSIEETVGQDLMQAQVEGHNLLIGHNAGIRTNHIDGFLAAKKLDLHGRKIVSVMVYGESWYRNCLIKIGELLFAKQFHAQIDFLPRNEYNEMLCTCPIVVFPTYKPEAMGNCLTALWMGAKLYMYECNLKYKYFRHLGLKVFSIDRDFNRSNKNVLEPLSQQDILYNREILMREYGFNEMDVRIRELIKEIDK